MLQLPFSKAIPLWNRHPEWVKNEESTTKSLVGIVGRYLPFMETTIESIVVTSAILRSDSLKVNGSQSIKNIAIKIYKTVCNYIKLNKN